MGWSVHLHEEVGSSLSQIEKSFVVARLNALVAVCWERENLNFLVDNDYDDLLQMLEVLGGAAGTDIPKLIYLYPQSNSSHSFASSCMILLPPCDAIHVYRVHRRTYLANLLPDSHCLSLPLSEIWRLEMARTGNEQNYSQNLSCLTGEGCLHQLSCLGVF